MGGSKQQIKLWCAANKLILGRQLAGSMLVYMIDQLRRLLDGLSEPAIFRL